MEYMESHPDFIVPEARKKEMVNNFLLPGLQTFVFPVPRSSGGSRSISIRTMSFTFGLTR